MQLAYTILYVEDVEKTLKFYELAFGFKRKMLHPEGDYGELSTGATTLSFSSLKLMRKLGKHPSSPLKGKPTFEIVFSTKNVAAALQKALSAGAEQIQEPLEMPWGQTTAYVNDPNGFLIEICTPIS